MDLAGSLSCRGRQGDSLTKKQCYHRTACKYRILDYLVQFCESLKHSGIFCGVQGCLCLSINHTLAALIAVHGAWDEWSPWSLCSSTCGRGYRSRTRTCTPPQFGGDPCPGPEKQTKFCNIAVCPGKENTSKNTCKGHVKVK